MLSSAPIPPLKTENLTLMEFYSGQPDNLAASVRDYCTGVLIPPLPESIKRIAQLYGVEKQARGQSPVAPFCSGTLAPICTGIDRRAAASENWLQQGTNSLSYTPNGSTSDPFQPHGPNHIHKVHDTRSLSVTSVSPIELPYEPT